MRCVTGYKDRVDERLQVTDSHYSSVLHLTEYSAPDNAAPQPLDTSSPPFPRPAAAADFGTVSLDDAWKTLSTGDGKDSTH